MYLKYHVGQQGILHKSVQSKLCREWHRRIAWRTSPFMMKTEFNMQESAFPWLKNRLNSWSMGVWMKTVTRNVQRACWRGGGQVVRIGKIVGCGLLEICKGSSHEGDKKCCSHHRKLWGRGWISCRFRQTFCHKTSCFYLSTQDIFIFIHSHFSYLFKKTLKNKNKKTHLSVFRTKMRRKYRKVLKGT